MLDAHFDQLIRARLAQLELPFRPEDWVEMEARLDQIFDQHIKTKLLTHSEALTPEAWSLMAEKLNEAFDRQIRDRLLQIDQATGIPSEWPLMQALLDGNSFEYQLLRKLLSLRLDHEVPQWETMLQRLEDDQFISYLRQQLEALRIQGVQPSWTVLEDHIDQEFDRQVGQKLGNTFSEEVPSEADWDALELELTGNAFDQSVRNALESLPATSFDENREGDWLALTNELDSPFDVAMQELLHQASIPAKSEWARMQALLAEGTASTAIASNSVFWRRGLTVAASVLIFLLAGIWWQTGDRTRISQMFKPKPGSGPIRPIDQFASNEPTTESSDANLLASEQNNHTQAHSHTTAPELAPLQQLNSAQTVSLVSQINGGVSDEAPRPTLPQIDKPKAGSEESDQAGRSIIPLRPRYIALASSQFGAQSAMEALLPPDDYPADIRIGLVGGITHTKAELSGPQADPGYQVALRLELGVSNNWQVITGIGYGERHFSHEYLVSFQEKLLRNRLEASMRVVELPLMMRYRFPSNGDLSLYAQGGIVAVLSLSENYQHYDPSAPVNANRLAIPSQLEPQQRAWNLISYPGNIAVGLGLEYQASDRLSFQVEPYFIQSLQRTKGSGSLGLEKKLYTTGINAGIIFDLGKE